MKKRLYQLAEYLKISVRNLEVSSGLQRGNISNISENGTIGSDKLSKIYAAFPQVNLEWLITGEGEMLKSKHHKKKDKSKKKNKKQIVGLQVVNPLNPQMGDHSEKIQHLEQQLNAKDQMIEQFKQLMNAKDQIINDKMSIIELLQKPKR